ncbi:MAG: Predicted L-lactate dehydrogenase, Fe-S oxidoreductase subunit YkgE / Predicted L-lactate dehydrogenase, Iron-sulfur cluster-binding subunit YkgF, partial [uncultured Thermomicrobiales bacterium]
AGRRARRPRRPGGHLSQLLPVAQRARSQGAAAPPDHGGAGAGTARAAGGGGLLRLRRLGLERPPAAGRAHLGAQAGEPRPDRGDHPDHRQPRLHHAPARRHRRERAHGPRPPPRRTPRRAAAGAVPRRVLWAGGARGGRRL